MPEFDEIVINTTHVRYSGLSMVAFIKFVYLFLEGFIPPVYKFLHAHISHTKVWIKTDLRRQGSDLE